MHYLNEIIGLFLHLDKHLSAIIQQFGSWTYGLLFLIIFAETGLVVTPFLPGDSLLFTVGALAAVGSLDIWRAFIVLSLAAIIGDGINYAIGNFLGPKVFQKENSRVLKKEYLDKTHKFYDKYGATTIVLARFVPIVRTFAPFVAGVGKMGYPRFAAYNIVGGILWVGLFVWGGYFFGNIPFIKNNFSWTIFIIIGLSLLPVLIEFWKHHRSK
jgi:membrane-associated protein